MSEKQGFVGHISQSQIDTRTEIEGYHNDAYHDGFYYDSEIGVPIGRNEGTVFHLSREDGRPLLSLSCQVCGGTDFRVGQRRGSIAIRCEPCDYEIYLVR